MSKCKGCGVKLQIVSEDEIGYTPKKDSILCQRCFKITHYSMQTSSDVRLSNDEIITKINSKKGATLFLCDLLNLNRKTVELFSKISEPKLFVVTKADMIPQNIKFDILKENIQKEYLIGDLIFVSYLTSQGKKDVLNYLDKHSKVIFAGPTSSGKSSLINYLFGTKLTVSNHKNTTQEFISMKIDSYEVIDAPGFNDLTFKDSSKHKGYIKPRTLFLRKDYVLKVNNFEIYFDRDVNLTAFFPKNIILTTKKKHEVFEITMNIFNQSDVVVSNIGFIYVKDGAKAYIKPRDYLEVRHSVVGGK